MYNSIYIGQSQSLENRMKTHIKGSILYIKDNSSCTWVVDHFNKIGHNTTRDYEFFVLKESILN